MDFKDENGDPIPSKTEQCHKETCDIRNIIKQYDKNGLLLHVNKAKEFYGDFTEVNEYQESLNKVIEAENLFLGLPSEVRKEFDNDPGKFLEFVSNPENEEKMINMGLAKAPVPEPVTKVEVVNTETEVASE